MIKSTLYILCSICFLTSFSFQASAQTKTTAQLEIQNALDKIMENFENPMITPGAVIASPSRQEPDYFFHWTRDAGLTILSLMIDANRPELSRTIENWGRFERYTQIQAMKEGGPGLGEPKFLVSGNIFTGPWGRPQNDGPAIRSLAYLRAFHKIDKYVEADINYLLQNWQVPSFDLWEEVRGHHFFTRYAQMTAFRYAALHYQAGMSSQNAKLLYKEAAKIEKSLHAFIDPNRGMVTPTLAGSEGVQKHAGLDVSVILAMNYFGSTAQPSQNIEPDWSFSQPNMLYTSYKLSETFRNHYAINQKFSYMAPGIGRYPEDVYDGNGFSGAHPWFLATFGMAEYYCSLIDELAEKGSINTDPLSRTFYTSVYPSAAFNRSGKIMSNETEFWNVLRALQKGAESYIQRAAFHAGQDGRFSEQFDRDSGYRRGASDLTWSYASKIRAVNRCAGTASLLQRFAK